MRAGRILWLAGLACVLTSLSVTVTVASAGAAPVLPTLPPPAVCSDTTVGELPCTWTDGVNAYPGNSDGFGRTGTLAAVAGLVSANRFNTVVINVPISAANYTDAHVEMPPGGQHEVYNCESANADYLSPTRAQVIAIGRRALATRPGGLVVVRPLLALGGSCSAARYYPTGRYSGSDFTKGASNEAAFAHFYTAILLDLAADATAISHSGRVVLDDATQLDCLFDDPGNAGYVTYFAQLPGQISRRYPSLAQMVSLDTDFADHPGSRCGYAGSNAGRPAYDEVTRDRRFLSEVGIVGIQANFALAGANPSVPGVVSRWARTTTAVKGARRLTADGLVRYLHAATGADVVMSAIGYDDCSNNPAADPTAVPAFCNKVYGRVQGKPSRTEVTAEQHADTAAYCYWTQAEGSTDPWFLGFWWWNRDFDAAPYVNPYDLTWGAGNLGTSALASVRAFNLGRSANHCPAVRSSTPASAAPATT
jgi:hypothetical protein